MLVNDRVGGRAAAVVAVAVLLCGTVEVQAQVEIEPCTGQPASVKIEQLDLLNEIEKNMARLSRGDINNIPNLKRLLNDAGDRLRTLREGSLVDALAFARRVDRILEVGSGVVYTEPRLATTWARFRLTFAESLQRGDCLGKAERLLAASRVLPITDPDVTAGVAVSHGAVLVELGRFPEAIDTLRPFLKAEAAPRSFTELRAHIGALNNLAVAFRQSGKRIEARRVYEQILTLVLDPASMTLIETTEDRLIYDENLGKLYLNLAALALYNEDTNETWAYLQKARAALERAGQSESYTMVKWFRTAADYWMGVGDDNAARDNLRQGQALAGRVAPESVTLRSELSRRSNQIGVTDTESVQQLLEHERALERYPEANWSAKVKIAEALSDAYGDQEDWDRAVEWARVAYTRMQKVAGGPTIELARTQIKLAMALAANAEAVVTQEERRLTPPQRRLTELANTKQIAEAYEMSRAAARTVREIGEREAIGCQIAQEGNPKLVKKIREWHGTLSSILLQRPGIEDTSFYLEIVNEVLGLVQAQETDRLGAATLRGAARNRPSDRHAVQTYEDLLQEKCMLEEELWQLLSASEPDHASLASKRERLGRLTEELEVVLARLDPIRASALSGGRTILTHNELGNVLRPGEAILAFRLGDDFSVASLTMRPGSKSTTGAIPLPKATFDRVKVAVSKILKVIEVDGDLGSARKSLSDLLRMEELQLLMEKSGIKHVFLVPDGHLRRLPSHLLPVGTRNLSDVSNSSTVASIWGFAALRKMVFNSARSRSVYAIGDPELHHVPCELFPLPETTIHHEVMCLGKPGGLKRLLHGAQELLGGPAPLMGAAATREALLDAAPKEAGVLLFATHGLVPETKEISYLDEPALVLSPDQTDTEEDGLLLASQVADLRFDDSWLAILAACRSGTPSGTDISDGLSGLAWGFTAAGTDALLVTHWEINVDAASEIVLHILRQMASDSTLTLAAALDDAMRAYSEKHPNTREWGGFSILGDGTVTMPAQ